MTFPYTFEVDQARARAALAKEPSLAWRRFSYAVFVFINGSLCAIDLATHRSLVATIVFGCATILWLAAIVQLPPRALVPRRITLTSEGIDYDDADGAGTAVPWRMVRRVVRSKDALVFVIAGPRGRRPPPEVLVPSVAGDAAFGALWQLLHATLVSRKNLQPTHLATLRVIENTALRGGP